MNLLDDESGGAKAAEVSDEIFRDKLRKTQKAQKAAKKAEKNSRAKDDRLAKVIGKFLQNRASTGSMILIARCLDQNIPAGMILGILALVEAEAQKEFAVVLGENAQILAAPKIENCAIVEHSDFPPEIKNALDIWSFGLLEFGLTQPTRLLATAISPENKLFPDIQKLTTFVIRDFLESKNACPRLGSGVDFDKITDFAELILKTVLGKIKISLAETRELSAGESD